ncbi:voltage-gated monoatomic cation channel TMEM109 [Clarias gariepinus]
MAKVLVTVVLISFTLNCERVCAVSETASTMYSAVRSLADDAHSYLVSLLGKKTVDTLLKTMGDAVKVTSQATAHALNVVAAYIEDLLDFKMPEKRFTPEGVVFVAQWALLAVLAYWLLSLAVCLLSGVFRRTLFLLKVVFAIAAFGLIVSDGEASAETTAMRLAGLVFACILLGVGPSFWRGDATTHLEQKVKALEKQLREMERKIKEE